MLQTLKNWFRKRRESTKYRSSAPTPKIVAKQMHLHWHFSDATQIPRQATWNANPITSYQPAVKPIEIETASTVSAAFDEALLDRAKTQWQFGAWDSLAALTQEDIESHPERAKLALLAGAAQLQLGNDSMARQLISQARQWGCEKRLISRILIAGTYNSLGKAAAITGDNDKAFDFFEQAISSAQPNGEIKLLAQARTQSQFAQLNLPDTDEIALGKLKDHHSLL
ncbi:hypothetical protein [Methylotuvimicrobium buryatense]|uniref:Tetratricopeptide repeat protein n=1 Tax=Methylotuvimicrobium buryatense TaxID=95641 RepID=A0A4P9UTS1_METBY|nr:hypothetical protein [Methylotuvimicrobium buryatense]QCW84003.1 hypothetical protein EQU24_18465 [Methylotuvimicrobium buryatense]